MPLHLDWRDPLAVVATAAIAGGEFEALAGLLEHNTGLAGARIDKPRGARVESRSLLHVATDWPGHLPNVAATVRLLVAAGADVNAAFAGGAHTETPLHWASSSDDVTALDALVECGADIEATGGVIGGGTPMADAVAFGQWNAARRLLQLGARTTLWQAAALGLLDRVQAALDAAPPPAAGEITNALWCACHGGQLATARFLAARGGDLGWIGHDGLTPRAAALRSKAPADLIEWLGSQT